MKAIRNRLTIVLALNVVVLGYKMVVNLLKVSPLVISIILLGCPVIGKMLIF